MCSAKAWQLSTVLVGLFLSPACQPTIDLGGAYEPIDYPWSGLPRIEVFTEFPEPSFTGTFALLVLSEYVEVPISGVIGRQNRLVFTPRTDDPLIWGLCVCQGFDDGSSIYGGSGEIAGDGLGDRLACGIYLGRPADPPTEMFRIDW